MSKSNKRFTRNESNLLMAIIGDEETVTGFLLAGIGERNEHSKNFFIINKEDDSEISDIFKGLTQRRDVGIILISQDIADRIRPAIDEYQEIIPTVLEIPSKNVPYSIEKDSIMERAFRQLYGSNANIGGNA